MANLNTISYAPNLPAAAVGASSTAEIQFLNNLGAHAIARVAAGQFTNRRLRVRAGGRVTGGTTTNVTFKVYYGDLTTSIASSGAIAVNSASGNWVIEASVEVDSTSSKLQGQFSGQTNGSLVTAAATTTVSSVSVSSELDISASATFSASNSGNAAILDYLEVDAV